MIVSKNLKNFKIDWNTFYVVADFDQTITSEESKSSWDIFLHSDVPEDYKKLNQELYNKYRPIEIDESLDPEKRIKLTIEWYERDIKGIIDYKLKEQIFNINDDNADLMVFKEGAKEFIKFLHENNIPLIILSGGIGNYIEDFLKINGLYFDNVFIASNIFTFKNGVASGLRNGIIHSYNKNEVELPQNFQEKIKNRPNVLLLGDQTSDLNMVDYNAHDKVITACFMNSETSAFKDNYKDSFDILIEEDEDYNTLFAFLERNN